ncbi:MAG: aldehyde dehydrogenase family protein [Pirellulales bacterium]|nr:aldehyde dehydrogenase family protein [Pirellulales bacterium]
MSTIVSQIDLLPEVQEFLGRSPLKALVGGQEVAASNGETFQTIDPGSQNLLAEVHNLQPDDVDRAIDAAADAYRSSGWATMPVNKRSALLHRLADTLEAHQTALAQIESIDCGKVFAQAEGDVAACFGTFRNFADAALNIQPYTELAIKNHESRVVRHSWGPCGFIVPWNFPLLLLGWGLAPALAAGNTVVLKPAEDTPLSSLYFAHLAKQAGIPDGVINVLPGIGEITGAALSANPKLQRMSFTGSPEVGRLVAEASGRNLTPVKLELGGKGAAVIFDDVDISDTADKLVQAITFNTGQVCCDATRWLVQKNIYDQFVDECVVRLQSVKIGHEMDEGTQMGPVMNQIQRNRVLSYLEKGKAEGAEMLLEGGAAEVEGRDGFYVKPALLSGSSSNVASREEIFGPVAYLSTFDDEGEAVAMANDTEYGLANSVWSSDLSRCNRVAEGMVVANSWINAHNVFEFGIPYAGINKSGMGGGVNCLATLMDYYRDQSVTRPL